MRFFADTASISEIEYQFTRGVNDGITTNPMIMETTGDLSTGFIGACKSLLKKFPSVPISLETDLASMSMEEVYNNPTKVRDILLKQAYELSSLGTNVVVKIPICEGGLLATEELAKKGIKTNVTACMSAYQSMRAVDAGATYVSLFGNRMLDCYVFELSGKNLETSLKNENWKTELARLKEDKKILHDAWDKTLNEISYVATRLDDKKTKLIVGSIRSPQDIYKLAKAHPQIITIPTKITEGLENISKIKDIPRSIHATKPSAWNQLYHPMTHVTIVQFEKAADSYRK